ncbi:MAG: hypothetical protein DME19_20485 [Verrucomicrobia bacterium]|nr:MAG: hypothetical protein DME19_20485 [Verrucomicrobiota bacterium]
MHRILGRLTSFAAFFFLATTVCAQGILVPRGSVWKYLDNGSDQGTAWQGTNFNDSGWASGPARLGYGGDGEVTAVNYGPDINNKYITTYFRKTFAVSNPSAFTTLNLNLLRDDGAVVYLNGTEIRRDNMPTGTITYTTLASSTIGGTDEQTFFPSTVANLLLNGNNLLAVEIHQAATNSSDISLDLELRGTNLPPDVAVTSPANNATFAAGANITITAGASDSDGAVVRVEFFQGVVKLGESANSPYGILWNDVSDGQYTLTAVATDNDGATATSAPVAITVNDTNPPVLVSAIASGNNVIVNFSKRLSAASATNINNYAIDNGVQVLSAGFGSSSNTVILGTTPLTTGLNYTLTVNGVQDAGGNVIAPDSQTAFSLVPYSPTDIGGPGISGSMSFSGGTYTLTGAGANIGGASDQFFFSYQQLTGDFDMQVRVLGVNPSDAWAKAGLMARESLAAGSAFAAILASPSVSGCFFESRATTDGGTATTGAFPVNYPNTWLRLQRVGSQFTGYASFDGQSWTQLGSVSLTLPNTLYFGMALTSHNINQATSAQMRDLGITTATGGGPLTLPSEPLGPSSRKTGLAISEIMYKPAPRADGKVLEYLELFNSNPFFEDITGYRLSGDIDFIFPTNTVLPGAAFLVVADSPADVQSVYGITNVIGPYTNALKSSGTVRLRSDIGAILLEVPYSNKPPWPVAADGTGHSLVLARPSYGEAFPKAWDISDVVGGSPGTVESYRPGPLRNVVINEFLAHTDDPLLDYIELYNHSNQEVDISNCVLTDDAQTNKFIVPTNTVIQARSFKVFDQSQMGFALSAAGDTIYFKNPDGSRVLDAVRFGGQENSVSTGRYPDGADEFHRLNTRTPGAPNSDIRTHDVVINEIMYAPMSGNSDDQYVELYNQGTNAVNLSGWRFSDGIDFTFPTNTVLPVNAYLVVARNAAHLLTNYTSLTGANTLGDFGGKLNKGERLALAMPDQIIVTNKQGIVETNTIHIDVDEVTYAAGGRWGHWANEGGSSLELIDPRSDHRLPSNWADSDETGKAPWTEIEATDRLDKGQGYNGGPIDNLQVVMLGEGECLIDNVEVFNVADGVNLISNSTFEAGLTGWTAQGDHVRSGLEAAGGYNSSRSLHLRASQRGDTGANRVYGTFTSNPVPGDTLTIRAQVRWLRGWPEIVMRTHGNWMEAAGRMTVPTNLGTPGARNSRAVNNAGPAIYQVVHNPIVPAANQPVVVTARVHDPDDVASAVLNYRIDPATNYTTVTLTDDGAGGDAVAGDGIFSATIPAQAGGTMSAFYLQATDSRGAATTFPNDAPARECLVRFGDPTPTLSFRIYRQWFTQSAVSTWVNRPVLSNEDADGTFVYGNYRVVYNFGSHFAGSPYHQGFGSPASDGHYSIQFPLDDLLLGTENFNKIHAPGNGPFDDNTIQREQACFWLARKLGLPYNYRRFVAMYFNGARRGTLMEDTQTPGSDMVDEYFADDNNGFLYKLQPWFEVANCNSRSMGFSNNSWCTLNDFLDFTGNKKLARFRWNYLVRAVQGSANNYTNVFALIDAANSFDPAALESVADMEEWMRIFAVRHAVGDWDSVGCQNEQNMYGYKPLNGRWTLFIWDMNIVLGNSGSWGMGQNLFSVNGADGPMRNIYQTPPFRRAYWRALKELCNGPMLATNFNPLVDAKYAAFQASGINVAAPTTPKSYVAGARTSILSQLAAQDATGFAAGGPGTTANNLVTLTGDAPVEIKTIRVNGVAYPLSWSSVTGWSLTVPLNAGPNTLLLSAYDVHGRLLSNYTATVSVNYSGSVELPQDYLVINEIMYAPAIPGAEFVEIYNRSPDFTFDLSNHRFNGLDYTFPEGSVIAPNGFVVLARDRAAFNAAYGGGIPVFGLFNGRLDPDSETLALIKPGAAPAQDVAVSKVRYETQPPWPVLGTNSGVSLQLIDPSGGASHRANWAVSSSGPFATPGAANSIQSSLPAFPALWINEIEPENLNGIRDNANQADPWIEIYNAGTTVISLDGLYLANNYTNLTQWAFPAGAQLAPGRFKIIFVDGQPGQSTAGEWHSSFRLNAGSGSVALSFLDLNNRPQVLDYVNYNGVHPDRSFGSFPDGQPFDRSEFYFVTPGATNNATSAPLNVFINEWMASNAGSLLDPADNHFDDWFELYNPGAAIADLAGCYLTDALTNKFKFLIPSGYTIPPGGHLLVWADSDAGQNSTNSPDLHASFKLSAALGQIGLFAADGTAIDTVSYGAQTTDVSEGRYPDGGPNIYVMPAPTPRAANLGPQSNAPPALAPIGNRSVVGGYTLSLIATAADTNQPPQTLTFTLDSGAPTGASINPSTGVFTWTPSPAQTPGTNTVTVRVTDNGTPPLSDTETFTIFVIAPPQFTQTTLNGQQLTLAWQTAPGHTYRVEFKNDLNATAWTPLSGDMTAGGASLTANIDVTGAPQQFYRILLVN